MNLTLSQRLQLDELLNNIRQNTTDPWRAGLEHLISVYHVELSALGFSYYQGKGRGASFIRLKDEASDYVTQDELVSYLTNQQNIEGDRWLLISGCISSYDPYHEVIIIIVSDDDLSDWVGFKFRLPIPPYEAIALFAEAD